MKSGKSKAKGNKFENDISKQLSYWMFKDKNILGRHLTSGAIKTAWMGDIVPVKQLPKSFNRKFPFLFECKHGYGNDIPTFIKYTRVLKWLYKCIDESEMSKEQKIICLVAKFKYQKTIFITNHLIDPNTLLFNIALPINHQNQIIYFYSYVLPELLEYDFFKLFSSIF